MYVYQIHNMCHGHGYFHSPLAQLNSSRRRWREIPPSRGLKYTYCKESPIMVRLTMAHMGESWETRIRICWGSSFEPTVCPSTRESLISIARFPIISCYSCHQPQFHIIRDFWLEWHWDVTHRLEWHRESMGPEMLLCGEAKETAFLEE